jgi:Protein of unknown function (DUF2958)
MKLITEAQLTELLANGSAYRAAINAGQDFDPKPVVKLIHRNACSRWLLVAIDPTNTDDAYGLRDIGNGVPTIGFVSLGALEAVHDIYGTGVEPDPRFVSEMPLSGYTEIAYRRGLIITD